MIPTNKKEEQPNNKLNFFWVTCRNCKKKMAIPPDWVFKYLARIEGYEHEEETTQK